jgi:putative ABC transport system permease protein
MDRILYEMTESVRIAMAQIRANKMRSALTALGVIIGIVAVTLMGTAINGIDIGFERSLAVIGDDMIYVQKWPWHGVEDWWNYANRPPFHIQDADNLNRIFESTPGSLIAFAIPTAGRQSTVKSGQNQVSGVQTIGSTSDYGLTMAADFKEGRLFNENESRAGTQVCVLGIDVAEKLFPGKSAMGESVKIEGHPFRVIGVLARQGAFLGLFSLDNQAVIPINAYRKFFDVRNGQVQLRMKVKDKLKMDDAQEEVTGAMRRVRGLLPGQRDNFSVEQQQAFKAQLDPIKQGIAFAGLFVTGLSLFVGAIGIMNITFVSVRERTKEIGTRKALGARRRTILLQFLIESVSISFAGGIVGLGVTYLLGVAVKSAMPSFPLVFSFGLILISILVSVATGIVSGFVPAMGASRLDPVVALRYE